MLFPVHLNYLARLQYLARLSVEASILSTFTFWEINAPIPLTKSQCKRAIRPGFHTKSSLIETRLLGHANKGDARNFPKRGLTLSMRGLKCGEQDTINRKNLKKIILYLLTGATMF